MHLHFGRSERLKNLGQPTNSTEARGPKNIGQPFTSGETSGSRNLGQLTNSSEAISLRNFGQANTAWTSPLDVADRLAEIAIFTLAPTCGAFNK